MHLILKIVKCETFHARVLKIKHILIVYVSFLDKWVVRVSPQPEVFLFSTVQLILYIV